MAPINTGGVNIDSFKVVSNPGNIFKTGNASPIIITGLNNNTAYSFAVTAYNKVGSSATITSNIVIPSNNYNIVTGVVNGQILSNQSVIRDSSIRITYKNNAGYTLDSIIVNNKYIGKDSINGYTFKKVSGDSTIKVVYKIQTFTIVSTFENGGSISPQGTRSVNYGARPIYSITPNMGYIIDSVIVNGVKVTIVNNSYTFDSVKSNQTIGAYFKQITKPSKPLNVIANVANAQSTISFSKSIDSGGVSIIKYIVQVVGGTQKDSNISSPITITGLTNGQQYKFSVKAVNSYGLESDTTESNTIIPDNNIRRITTIAINGTITKDTLISLGGNIVITYSPNEGYEIDSIYINNVYSSKITRDSVNKYTFRNVLRDSSIKIVNKIKVYTITASAGTGGSISPQGTTSVNYNSKQQYTITPNTGFVIDTLFVNGIKV
ncbi:MAG: fibronectin type III domain-containing protein, partial [Sediminibacterium sp.]|nr:fibronectin type III domain-containing protein [Sediminibacterium sp.]